MLAAFRIMKPWWVSQTTWFISNAWLRVKENHFDVDHHPCPHVDCLARKFVVFNTPIDLKVHMVEEHGADMNSKDRKDARRIHTDFIFENGRRGRRDRVGELDRETPSPRLQQQQPHASSSTPASGQFLPTGLRRREGFGAALTESASISTRTNQNVRPPSPTEVGSAEAECVFSTVPFLLIDGIFD